jgi:hypothetical protein
VVETLAFALLATWALRRFPGHPAAGPPAPLRFELEGALASGLAVWAFTGTPLYVAVAAVPLGWAAFRHGEVGGSGGPGLAAGGLLSALLTLPAISGHGRIISFQYPSLLQPTLLLIAGLAIGACAVAGRASRGAARLHPLAVGALLLGVVVVAWMVQSVAGEVWAGITGWIFHDDVWLMTVSEFKPPIHLGPGAGVVYRQAYWALGWVFFVVPVSLVVVAAGLGRTPRGRWLIWFAGAAFGLTLLQSRFGRVAVPFFGAAVGLALMWALRRLAKGRRWLLALPIPVLLLMGTFLLDGPTRSLLRPSSRGLPDPVDEMAFELRDLPPAADLPAGVLSNWSFGHQLQVQSGLPVLVNGFGSYLDGRAFWAAVEIFRGPAELFDAFLQANRVGTVVAGPATLGMEVSGASLSPTFEKGGLNEPYMVSIPLSPLLIAGSAVPNWNVPHLPHLLPRAASRAVVRGLAFPLPFLWSYERVAGATVKGTAPAGKRVVAELRFKEQGRAHTYKAYADAAIDGRWSMVLPFPTGLTRPTIRSDSSWRVSAGGGAPLEFALPEASVRSGATLDVGRLQGAP